MKSACIITKSPGVITPAEISFAAMSRLAIIPRLNTSCYPMFKFPNEY